MKWSGVQRVLRRPGRASSQALLLDFLPAALEIRDKPPHPAGRLTGWLLMTLFAVGLIWACIGQVDIVATAEGKIIPSGQVKLIQPYERGVVGRIWVDEGQSVRKGDPLVDLDTTLTGADASRLGRELLQNQLNSRRLEVFLRALDDGAVSTVSWPAGVDAMLIHAQEALLREMLESHRAARARLERLLEAKRAELAMNASSIAKLSGTLPLVTQRSEALATLSERRMVAEVAYLELEQSRIEQQHDLEAARSQGLLLRAQIAELEQQRASLEAQTRRDAREQLVELQREAGTLQEELIKARELNRKQRLIAPVDGVVQQLAVHTTGGVVSPAEVLMKVVPRDPQLVAEVWLENKDIGFVAQGQPAEIKVHTFPFTKYGVIDGAIVRISADATADERKGLIYKAQIQLSRSTLNVEGREVDLLPGMGVSAEVKTGKRYLIEFIMAPLLRYKSDSAEER
ncbi:HlyD family type I secretion periplasmic adaptor subunit [Marinobacterium nitratireducens]|uniref:Membrane fusion protein (MFP) family protein n=1 Tax=Marinobacterium nitratireducens TaxID=518897 RepID=A0A917ZLK8_9GAMM|nr:HlyD family type I secretion periplasmic adaptor subunit [Marinobacterium nitratireducens]GGO85256.1 HlyD family type I secretion periplasmic adaptor subunit [Marinobacterium nitratireducens]